MTVSREKTDSGEVISLALAVYRIYQNRSKILQMSATAKPAPTSNADLSSKSTKELLPGRMRTRIQTKTIVIVMKKNI